MSSFAILFVVVGQFLNALVVVLDRFIVSKKVVSAPLVYAIYVSIMSLFVLILIPFGGLTMPSLHISLIYGVAAVSYVLSIYLLFESLVGGDPSEVVPVVGGIAAIATFAGNALILHEALPAHFAIGFVFLVFGMVLVSHFSFSKQSLWNIASSGVFFGISTVLIKYVFHTETFLDGFFWSRIANVVVALGLLLMPGIWQLMRHDARSETQRGDTRNKFLFITANKVLGGLAFVCILLAIKFGNVALINALSALQYLFLIAFGFLFGRRFSQYFKTHDHPYETLHKTLAASLILIGFIILFM